MDKEEYYRVFIRHVRPSDDNESVNLSSLRKPIYDIYYSYNGRSINEDDIKRDVDIFLLGMKTGRSQASEIESFRRVTKTLSGLLHRVGQG